MKDRIRYIVAVALGVLAIPGLALASNAALSTSPDDSTTTTTSATAAASGIAAEDLVRACGVEGRYLVDLEATGTIDSVQQAALDALRPICDEASLPLPAVVVSDSGLVATAPVAPVSQAGTTATTTTTPSTDYGDALAAREQALIAIQAATDAGGNVDKINAAISLVAEGDAAYETANFDDAEYLYEQAEELADAAAMEPTGYHDEDEDDHDEDEDDHDDEGEEDEDDEEDD
ncbi:MAG: hypothetical protein HKO87_09290 [Acidimicrobiia bacterium]|nr:hypothetical protein [Acidimicrobiia bacterium]